MTAIPLPQAAAAGGSVNMARGLGTALGVAPVNLALAWARRSVGAGRNSRAFRAGGHDCGAVPR